jgi:hypothetical protein
MQVQLSASYKNDFVRILFYISLAKVFAPLAFLTFFIFLTKGYNSQTFPWHQLPDAHWRQIVLFAGLAATIFIFLGATISFLVVKLTGGNPFEWGIQNLKHNFPLVTANVICALTIPFGFIIKHSNVWHFLYDPIRR